MNVKHARYTVYSREKMPVKSEGGGPSRGHVELAHSDDLLPLTVTFAQLLSSTMGLLTRYLSSLRASGSPPVSEAEYQVKRYQKRQVLLGRVTKALPYLTFVLAHLLGPQLKLTRPSS